MISTNTLADVLFKIRVHDVDICPGLKTNTTVSTPVVSSKRPKRTTTPPKISGLALQLKKVFNKNVSAVWSKDFRQVYAEVATDKGIEQFYYELDSNTLKTNSAQPAHFAIPMLLLAATGGLPTMFDETRDALDALVKGMDTVASTVDKAKLATLCDTFYYDWNAILPSATLNVDEFDSSTSMTIQQAIRVGSMDTVPTPLSGYIDNVFSSLGVTSSGTAAGATTTASAPSTLSTLFEEAKAGKYLLNCEWDEGQQSHIRPVESLDDYVPNATYRKLVNMTSKRLGRVIDRQLIGKTGLDAIGNDYTNIIIGGRPGTGKTTTADALSATLGLPIYTTAVTRNTEEDTFEGMTKVDADGKFLLHDTAFLNAFEHGGIVVVEEFNLADPGVLQGAIGQAIEYPFILFKDGYKEVHRHPLCIVIGTMNTGTQGAREPNQAFTSRLPFSFIMDDPDTETFVSILEKHGHERKTCERVYRAYSAILAYLKDVANDEEMALAVTMRHCLAALDLIKDEVVEDIREAVFDTMIGAISLRNMELAKDVYDNAIMPLPLNR